MAAVQKMTRWHRGMAMVEITITLPLLLFLVVAICELGRGYLHYDVLTQQVRDAARYLAGRALLGTTGIVNISAQLETETQNLVVYSQTTPTGTPRLPSLAPSQVTVSNLGGGNVSVSVSYPYVSFFGATLPTFGLGPGLALTFNMQAGVIMRAI